MKQLTLCAFSGHSARRRELSLSQNSINHGVLQKRIGKYSTFIILKNLPTIVGLDIRIYGHFKKGDVVTMPRENGLIFVRHSEAEEVTPAQNGLGKEKLLETSTTAGDFYSSHALNRRGGERDEN